MSGFAFPVDTTDAKLDAYEVDLELECPNCGGAVAYQGKAYTMHGEAICYLVGVECADCGKPYAIEFNIDPDVAGETAH